jgi:hypothetical protein
VIYLRAFKQCEFHYRRFIKDPAQFLGDFAYTCFADATGGRYALLAVIPPLPVEFAKSLGVSPLEGKKYIWLVLGPEGQVIASSLSRAESEEESKK